MSTANNTPAMRQETSLLDILRLLRDHKLIVAVLSLCGGLIAAMAAFVSEPEYRVETLVMSVSHADAGQLAAMSGGLSGIAALAGVRVNAPGSDREEALATLKSRKFIEDFIVEQDLLPVLFSEQWDGELKDWKSESRDAAPTAFDGFKRFRKDVLTVDEDSRSGLITISVTWSDPDLATSWAGYLVRRINLIMRERARSVARESIDYISAEMEKTSTVAIEQSLYQLLESELKTIVLANVRDDYVFRVIDPPAAPGPNDFVWPKTKEMILAGITFGLMFGIVVGFIVDLRKKL